MPDPTINIYQNINLLATGFTEFLIDEIYNILKNNNEIYISLSGGNTPKTIFSLIKEQYSNSFPWQKIHFYWGDERCVPFDNKESNYGETYRLLLNHINIPKGNIHPVMGENKPDFEVARYEQEIVKTVPENNDLPCFDFNFLGMGDDGHTASIFPDQIELLNADSLCALAFHPKTKQKRITLTGNILNNAKNICFLVAGKNKSEIVKHIVHKKQEALNYPAYYIQPFSGRLYFFLDESAASLI